MLLEDGIVNDDVVTFLKRVPPFQFLEERKLETLASSLSVKVYPKGSLILQQGRPASDYLQVIRYGRVKVYMSSGEGGEVLIDYRGEGDLIGYLSLFSDKSRANVTAEEDTTCYLISRATIRRLFDTNPAFGEFFLKSYLTIYIDKGLKEMHKKTLMQGAGDKVLFTTPVGELATREIVTASQEMSIREAAKIMSQKRISCLVIIDSDNLPVGILTDSDLREKVVAKERNVSEPVKNIMSLPLIRVDDKDYCIEAVLKMVKYNVHHLLVVKGGDLRGIITNHDLMMLQGSSPLSFWKDIEEQHAVDGLVTVSHKVNSMVGLLLREGAKAGNINKIISEIYDRLVRRVLEIGEKQFGPPPVAYCWIALGREGRKEQTFKTDQGNAIILADLESDREAEEITKYFVPFTAFVRDSLVKCGFPLSAGGYVAANPLWCQPLNTWKNYFLQWVSAPLSEPVLNAPLFFDFRPIHGEFSLAQRLQEAITPAIREHTVFLGYLANRAVKSRPPIGFLKALVLEKSGEHKDEINLEERGIEPLVDMVRLFALEEGVRETSTLERIEALREKHTVVKEYADDLSHVFEFVMLLRIQNQFEKIKGEKIPDSFINPNSLVKLEKKTLKEVFHFIVKLQDLVIDRYKQWPW